jgi:hypothetical protein
MVLDKVVAWCPIAMGLAAIAVTIYYGAIMLNYARWTKHNDFREGCINDRDHNLPLSAQCVTELMLPRVSAIKRQIEAVRDASVADALYWTCTVCITVSTGVFYMVRMRTFVRDEPRPIVSLARTDRSSRVQGHHEHESGVVTGKDRCLSNSSHGQDDKVYNHLQQDQINSPPSDSESEEDYFQAWKDGMKTSRANLVDSGSSTSGTPYSPGPTGRPLRRATLLLDQPPQWHRSANGLRQGGDGLLNLASRRRRAVLTGIPAHGDLESAIASDLHLVQTSSHPGARNSTPSAIESTRPRLFEVEFQPSGNRVECEHIELHGPLSDFQPADGLRLDVNLIDAFDGSLILKCPLERGATHVELLNEYNRFPPSCKKALHKRDMWAKRLNLPSHRFLYLVAIGHSSTRSLSGATSQ